MHALQKPVRGNFPSRPFGFCLVVNGGADGRELQTDADIVQEASRLPRIRPALRFAGDQILELRRR